MYDSDMIAYKNALVACVDNHLADAQKGLKELKEQSRDNTIQYNEYIPGLYRFDSKRASQMLKEFQDYLNKATDPLIESISNERRRIQDLYE